MSSLFDKQIKSDLSYSLSTDVALVMSKRFLRSMAQPFDQNQTGISLWSLEDIENKQAQVAAQFSKEMDAAPAGDEAFYEGLEDAALVEGMMDMDGV